MRGESTSPRPFEYIPPAEGAGNSSAAQLAEIQRKLRENGHGDVTVFCGTDGGFYTDSKTPLHELLMNSPKPASNNHDPYEGIRIARSSMPETNTTASDGGVSVRVARGTFTEISLDGIADPHLKAAFLATVAESIQEPDLSVTPRTHGDYSWPSHDENAGYTGTEDDLQTQAHYGEEPHESASDYEDVVPSKVVDRNTEEGIRTSEERRLAGGERRSKRKKGGVKTFLGMTGMMLASYGVAYSVSAHNSIEQELGRPVSVTEMMRLEFMFIGDKIL